MLYFDFPSGRLKLTGTLTFPKAKYLLLKFGAKDVLCEDIFDTVVRFAGCFLSHMSWVGSKAPSLLVQLLVVPAISLLLSTIACDTQYGVLSVPQVLFCRNALGGFKRGESRGDPA